MLSWVYSLSLHTHSHSLPLTYHPSYFFSLSHLLPSSLTFHTHWPLFTPPPPILLSFLFVWLKKIIFLWLSLLVLEENAASIEPTPYTEQHAAAHPVLAKVAQQIDEKLTKFEGGHAFVRLSSRSPKDAILGDVIDKHLDVETRKFLAEGNRPIIANMHPLVYVASAKALEVFCLSPPPCPPLSYPSLPPLFLKQYEP